MDYKFVYSTEVMSQCWNENPDNRPNCHTLKEMLYKILCFERMSQVIFNSIHSTEVYSFILRYYEFCVH